MAKPLHERHLVARGPRALLARELRLQRRALLGLQPARLVGAVREREQHDDPEHHRRDAPRDVDPLPALEAQPLGMVDDPAVHHLVGADLEQRVGDLRADDLRHRGGHEEVGQGARAIAAGEPVREVDDHARVEAGLREAEQEAHDVELEGRLHERRRRGRDPPRDHDPGDPLAGAPALDDQRAGDLEQEVAQEEHARPEADDRVVEPGQVAGHRQLRDRHVRPVDERDHIRDEDEGQEPAVRLPAGAVQGLHVGGRRQGARTLGHLPTNYHLGALRATPVVRI